jgi:hypothetical protein
MTMSFAAFAKPCPKPNASFFIDARRLHSLAIEAAVAIKTDFAIHHLTRPRVFAAGK